MKESTICWLFENGSSKNTCPFIFLVDHSSLISRKCPSYILSGHRPRCCGNITHDGCILYAEVRRVNPQVTSVHIRKNIEMMSAAFHVVRSPNLMLASAENRPSLDLCSGTREHISKPHDFFLPTVLADG